MINEAGEIYENQSRGTQKKPTDRCLARHRSVRFLMGTVRGGPKRCNTHDGNTLSGRHSCRYRYRIDRRRSWSFHADGHNFIDTHYCCLVQTIGCTHSRCFGYVQSELLCGSDARRICRDRSRVPCETKTGGESSDANSMWNISCAACCRNFLFCGHAAGSVQLFIVLQSIPWFCVIYGCRRTGVGSFFRCTLPFGIPDRRMAARL